MRLWPKVLFLFTFPALSLAATNGVLPASQFCTVGDSIAVGLKNIGIPGIAVGAKNTQVVLGYAQQLAAQKVPCKTVILSSGTSNELYKIGGATVNMENVKKNVPAQIRALKAAGKTVVLLGVGSQFNSDINDLLKQIAAQEGVTFSMLGNTPDKVHPNASQLFAVISNGTILDTTAASAPAPVNAPVAPPLTQTQSPSLLSQLMAPPTQVTNTPTNPISGSQLSPLFASFAQPTSASAPTGSAYVPTVASTPVPVTASYIAPTPVSQTLANFSTAPQAVTQSPLVLFTPSSALSNISVTATTSKTVQTPDTVTIKPIGNAQSTPNSFAGQSAPPQMTNSAPFSTLVLNMQQFMQSLLNFIHR